MTRQQQREEKLKKEEAYSKKTRKKQLEEEFLKKEFIYEKYCFDVSSPYFESMIEILENSKNRGLGKEKGYELHHKIPRSYFKKMNEPVIDKGNLYKLTYYEHFMVHYYAWKCATKAMKAPLSFALIQMKRVCCKSEPCSNANAIDLAKLFNSIKYDLYNDKKKHLEEKSIKYFSEKLSEKTQQFSIVTRIQGKDEIFLLRCNDCGYEFSRSIFSFLNSKRMLCENCYNKAYKESVSCLWFGIDYRFNKAVWYVTNVSYTPSMKLSNTLLTFSSSEIKRTGQKRYLDKFSLIDIKPKGYNWNLDPDRQYQPYICDYYFINDNDTTIKYHQIDNTVLTQHINSEIRQNEASKIEVWMVDYLYGYYRKDKQILKRIQKLLDKMVEINDGKDICDFKKKQ